ncbi:MAG: HlyD family secretion protein [Gemmataceae bacterium]|nr:HlyD family secretion protein [Gemmataceae bacterium]
MAAGFANGTSCRPSQPRRRATAFALLVTLSGMLAGSVVWLPGPTPQASGTDLETYTVRSDRLDRAIVARGDLEVARSREMDCQVKNLNRGSSYSTAIKWIIEDGSPVQRGQLLVELDDAALVEELQLRKSLLEQAHSARIQAEENAKILDSQSESDLQTARVAVQLAELDLRKYLEGEYAQKCKELHSRQSLAESDAELWRDRAAFSERLVREGFLTANQAQSDRAHLISARFGLERLQEEWRVLQQYTYPRTATELMSKLQEAQRALERVRHQAQAQKSQAEVDRLTKQRIYQIRLGRCAEIEDEIQKCLITAPHDGLVVYPPPDVSRGYGSARIAPGEPVWQGQLLMRISDLTKMQIRVRIHEALVAHVHAGVGQPVLIQVEALPERVLRGHVQQVAAVAAQPDWFSADVPVYPAVIAIDDPVEGFRLGMSATVTILDDREPEAGLAVPIQALVGSPALGPQRTCWVLTPEGPEERDVLVGRHTETLAEIVAGLDEGEEVILDPQALCSKEPASR